MCENYSVSRKKQNQKIENKWTTVTYYSVQVDEILVGKEVQKPKEHNSLP